MTKKEIQQGLNKLQEACIPTVLDPSIQTVMRVAMNQAFIFGVRTARGDIQSTTEALDLIEEWEHQFDI